MPATSIHHDFLQDLNSIGFSNAQSCRDLVDTHLPSCSLWLEHVCCSTEVIISTELVRMRGREGSEAGHETGEKFSATHISTTDSKCECE
ncbi:hypothetical protein E2C01_077132 [Portunus trituberculatus]|uniref:Uncharacterized protein n=1 Tax=Portunus trituberculatus TaxID=210409 RepID=A0A5B7IJJ3_PORTR|nr:hypothetical protein [Portunus trituberculatus]